MGQRLTDAEAMWLREYFHKKEIMMTVTAKFRVVSKVKHDGYDAVDVRFQPVITDGNTDWSKYTPGGEIRMWITNPAAADHFVEGKDYPVTFGDPEEPFAPEVAPAVLAG